MRSKFKTGDKVAMINDTLKGVIIKIEGDQILFENKDGFVFQCFENEIVKNENFTHHLKYSVDVKQIKKEAFAPKLKAKDKSSRKSKSLKVIEIDLHIHELIETSKGMHNFEMLQIQKNKIIHTLNKAIKEKSQKVIFIHGIGNGVLKKELYQILQKYPVDYYDAAYQKYGQGATEVYIYQNKKEF